MIVCSAKRSDVCVREGRMEERRTKEARTGGRAGWQPKKTRTPHRDVGNNEQSLAP